MTQPPASVPRTRQRLSPESRSQSILLAATQTFQQQDYHEVCVADIAHRAGTSEALIFRYFESKAELYNQVIQQSVDQLSDLQLQAQQALPDHCSARDRVRAWLEVYMDYIATVPKAWAAPFMTTASDPPQTFELRRSIRAAYVEQLRGFLTPQSSRRHEFALWGYFGFLDAACLSWVERNCDQNDLPDLISSALGALEGALGDWAG